MALYDDLARMLSELTGSQHVVLMRRSRPTPRHPRHGPPRYSLLVQRGPVAHVFFSGGRALNVSQMTYHLAAMCDMLIMGLLPVRDRDYYAPGTVVTWGACRTALEVVSDGPEGLCLRNVHGHCESWEPDSLPRGLHALLPGTPLGVLS